MKILSPEDRAKISVIERYITTLFSAGLPANPFFTLHGPMHVRSVIKHLNSLHRNSKLKLNEKESFLLLAATWFHDVGMIDGPREDHHIRSRKHVETLKDDILFENADLELDYIGLISQGHRKVDLDSDEYNDDVCGEYKIRLGLLAGLLRLADELDLDYRRAPKSLRKMIDKNLLKVSHLHWMTHYYVKGIEFLREVDSHGKVFVNISVSVRMPMSGYKEIFRRLIISPIERTLIEVRNRLQENDVRVRLIYRPTVEKVDRLSDEDFSLIKVLGLNKLQKRRDLFRSYYKKGNHQQALSVAIDYLNESLSSISGIFLGDVNFKTKALNLGLPGYLETEIDFISNFSRKLEQEGIVEPKILKRNCEILEAFLDDYFKWFYEELLRDWSEILRKVNDIKLLHAPRVSKFRDMEKIKEILLDVVALKCTELSGIRFSANEVVDEEYHLVNNIVNFLLNCSCELEIAYRLLAGIEKYSNVSTPDSLIEGKVFIDYLNMLEQIIKQYKSSLNQINCLRTKK